MGGLAAAIDLAVEGIDVTVVERGTAPGGKVRAVSVGAHMVDAGSTVFTMRSVYDALFDRAGTTLDAHLKLRPATILSRHTWSAEEQLDLFADPDRAEEAIGDFAGPADAKGYRAFRAEAAGMFHTLEHAFFERQPPSTWQMLGRVGLIRALRLKPYEIYMTELAKRLKDPRLRQMFGRFAAEAGTSPYQATAALMAAAHIEQDGVWFVEGGMQRVPQALAALAERHGARFRYDTPVAEIMIPGGRTTGVRLPDGEAIHADAVLMNGEPGALGAGLLGDAARPAAALPARFPQRALSATTWAAAGHASGPPLLQHNVFYSSDYPLEFNLINSGLLPTEPTTYLYAQDRTDTETGPAGPERLTGPERLLVKVFAPASGDRRAFNQVEIDQCLQGITSLLQRCGVQLRLTERPVMSTPATYQRLYPGSGGMLYGPAALAGTDHLARPGSRSPIPGLYLAGGGTHPGPGMPLATLSGRLAAFCIVKDLAKANPGSTRRSHRAATDGGILTPSATTAPTD